MWVRVEAELAGGHDQDVRADPAHARRCCRAPRGPGRSSRGVSEHGAVADIASVEDGIGRPGRQLAAELGVRMRVRVGDHGEPKRPVGTERIVAVDRTGLGAMPLS